MNTMKKLLFLLSLVLVSCCTLSQIPPQHIYFDATCKVLLPDYRSQVTVTGGCSGFTVTQVPAAGYVLNATNKSVTVHINALSTSGKSATIAFDVFAVDTIIITPNSSLLGDELAKVNALYDLADNMVGDMEMNMNNAFYNDTFRLENEFNTKLLVVTSKPGNPRTRYITFADSLDIPLVKHFK
jgi:hypothetical protein